MYKNPKKAKKTVQGAIAVNLQSKQYSKALEQARGLFKSEPTEANRDLLGHVLIETGRAHQAAGRTKNAVDACQEVFALNSSPANLVEAATLLASTGAAAHAVAALEFLPDAAARQVAFNQLIDSAVAKGVAGRPILPEEMHAGFDATLRAFAEYEAGRDDDARAALQVIGLQSPFLEWKVLLRGLIAYQNNEDARALENWQRLDPARLPARLCAALRAGIDETFLKALPEDRQHRLRMRRMSLQGVKFAAPLWEVREQLGASQFAAAFHKLESFLPQMRSEHPDLAKRLANVFFWTVINHGEPRDAERFLRAFGPPAEDPRLLRLHALALERRGQWSEAHRFWQELIAHIAASPGEWPGEVGIHVQAMIWRRMAFNAREAADLDMEFVVPFFNSRGKKSPPLKPDAAQCYEKALKLAPDHLGVRRELFLLHLESGNLAAARKVGAELLKRFPDHASTLEEMAVLCMGAKDYQAAEEFLTRAIQANPLDRSMTRVLAIVRQRRGLESALAGNFDEARALLEQAERLTDGPKSQVLCQWAVIEQKAKNYERAAELIARAMAEPNRRLDCLYALVGESIRVKLPPKAKKQFAADLKAALAGPVTPAEVAVLVASAASQHQVHDAAFHGQKTQEKSIIQFLATVHFDQFTEHQLEMLVKDLDILQARKAWLNCLNYARRHYLKNPRFRLSFVDYYLTENVQNPATHLAHEHLDAARRVVEKMPRGEEQQRLTEEIQEKDEILARLQSMQGSLMNMFDSVFGGFGSDDDDDEYDDDDDFF